MTFIQRFRAVSAVVVGLTLMFGSVATPVFAEGFGGALRGGLDDAAPKELQTSNELPDIVAGLISAVLSLLGIVLFAYLLYGGYVYMTAAGDSTQVKKALDIIRSAIIGLIIMAAAYGISLFVIDNVGDALTPAGSTPPPPPSG